MATAKQQSELAAVEYAGGDFASLLKKEFKPKTEEVRSESSVRSKHSPSKRWVIPN